MKKTAIAVLAVFMVLGSGSVVLAKTSGSASSFDRSALEIDGSFGFATGPGDFGSGYGVNFGAGYLLKTVDPNLQLRADISYFDFSYTYFLGYDLSYTRVPVTVSARYYFPIIRGLKAFAQAGLETSFDTYDYVDIFGTRHSKTEVNLGISPGGGVEFYINPMVSIFAVGRIHMISDSYFSMQFGGAYHF